MLLERKVKYELPFPRKQLTILYQRMIFSCASGKQNWWSTALEFILRHFSICIDFDVVPVIKYTIAIYCRGGVKLKMLCRAMRQK